MWPNGKGDITGVLEGLKLVMTDVGAFVALANHGTYSGPRSVGAAILGSGGGAATFADAANSYSTSDLLRANDWYAVPGDVGPAPLTGCTGFGNQGEAFAGKLCTASDGSNTVSYWSPISSRSYTLVHKSGNGVAPADLLKSIATNSWANMPVLFDGAYQCTFEGKAGPDIAFDDDGLPDTNCLSVLPIYLQCTTDCPQGATLVGKKCPFGYERKC